MEAGGLHERPAVAPPTKSSDLDPCTTPLTGTLRLLPRWMCGSWLRLAALRIQVAARLVGLAWSGSGRRRPKLSPKDSSRAGCSDGLIVGGNGGFDERAMSVRNARGCDGLVAF